MSAQPQPAANKLGLWSAVSLVVGNMIGAGVFMIPVTLAGFGSISLLGWVFSAAGTFFLARVFGNLSKLLPQVTGGPYAYTRHGFGDFAGFLVAWSYVICIALANAAIVISFVSALSAFFPVIGKSPAAAVGTGLSAIWLLTWLNTRGVAVSGRVQLVTTILKILPLLIIGIGGLFMIKATNFNPFNSTGTSAFTAVTAAAAVTVFSMVGIESASIPAASVVHPEKNISRATLLGLLIAVLVYLLGSISIMGMLPAKQLQHTLTPYADAGAIMFGPAARYVVSAGIAIAAFGALNGWILIQGQIPYAIAKDNLFPALFARENSRKVPYMGMIINSTLVSVFMVMNYTKGLADQFKSLLLLAVFMVFIPYLFSSLSYLMVRLKSKTNASGNLAGAVTLSLLAFAYSMWAIIGTGEQAVFNGFIGLMLSVPVYVWIKYSKGLN
ncbi:amino acid permease [Mucilaginibacter koreensis]